MNKLRQIAAARSYPEMKVSPGQDAHHTNKLQVRYLLEQILNAVKGELCNFYLKCK